MPRRPEEDKTRALLRHLHVRSWPIPESKIHERADLLAWDRALPRERRSWYLVEVKAREDSMPWIETLRNEMAVEGTASFARSASTDPGMMRHLRKASGQLAETTIPCESAFRLLALHDATYTGMGEGFLARFEATMLGMRPAFTSGNPRFDKIAPRCYFARRPVFLEFRQVVAALLVFGRSATLCVNPFCSRRVEFRESELWKSFPSEGRLDVDAIGNSADQMVYRGERWDNDQDIEDWLKTRYGCSMIKFIDLEETGAVSELRRQP